MEPSEDDINLLRQTALDRIEASEPGLWYLTSYARKSLNWTCNVLGCRSVSYQGYWKGEEWPSMAPPIPPPPWDGPDQGHQHAYVQPGLEAETSSQW